MKARQGATRSTVVFAATIAAIVVATFALASSSSPPRPSSSSAKFTSSGSQTQQVPQTNSTSATLTMTSTSIECTITAEGTGTFVTVLSDGGQPIQGAQVSGERVTEVNGATCEETIGTFLTNSTGSVLITPNIGSYYQLTIQYQGKTFSAQAPIQPMSGTYVTLKIPSGNVTVSEVPYGGCKVTLNSITCPG